MQAISIFDTYFAHKRVPFNDKTIIWNDYSNKTSRGWSVKNEFINILLTHNFFDLYYNFLNLKVMPAWEKGWSFLFPSKYNNNNKLLYEYECTQTQTKLHLIKF